MTDGESTRPKILLVDDVADNLKILRDTLEAEDYRITVATDGPSALRAASGAVPDLIFLDIQMPGMDGFEVCRRLKQDSATQDIPVIFITVKDEDRSLVKSFQVGGVDYITKPFQKAEVLARLQTHLKLKSLAEELRLKNRQLAEEFARCKSEVEARRRAEEARLQAENALEKADGQLDLISQQESARWGIEGFVGQSKTIQKILDEVRQVQSVGTTSVLITGESGTGKELIARAIHYGGQRSAQPFIPLNCSAIPGDLAESTLFGHVKGAFTGASDRQRGCFELADGGTLFLDEIGDMALELQAKLLRVLEDGHLRPVGAAQERQVDVRVVTATNADLQQRIAAGAFRQDLFFRLARFPVEVPPLRRRREDIPLLAQHFLDTLAAEMGRPQAALAPEALALLADYAFPGNVRELKNIIEIALIRSPDAFIRPEHLHFIANPQLPPPQSDAARAQIEETLIKRAQGSADEETDEARILAYVREHGSINNTECRDLLDVPHYRATYLLTKMHSYGLLARDGERRWARYRAS